MGKENIAYLRLDLDPRISEEELEEAKTEEEFDIDESGGEEEVT